MSENKNPACWMDEKHGSMYVKKEEDIEYYICATCNPTATIEDCIEGCLYKCHDCGDPMGTDNVYECEICNKYFCIACMNKGPDFETCEECA